MKREVRKQRGRKVHEVLIFHFEVCKDSMAEQDETGKCLGPGCGEPCARLCLKVIL